MYSSTIMRQLEGILFKFGILPCLHGGYLHSKLGAILIKQYRATHVLEISTLFFLSVYLGGPHDAPPCVLSSVIE